ncbi:MAG: aldehyde dehydrogenase family protein [Amaricoccus sp.]
MKQGGKIRFGGKRRNSYAFYEPTVIEDVTPGMDIARDMEVFGPVCRSSASTCSLDEVQIHNNSTYGLGGGIMTDMKTALQVARKLKTGHVAINASGGFRAAELPFGGGQKASGNSRESMSAVMDEVTQTKSIILRYVFNEGISHRRSPARSVTAAAPGLKASGARRNGKCRGEASVVSERGGSPVSAPL